MLFGLMAAILAALASYASPGSRPNDQICDAIAPVAASVPSVTQTTLPTEEGDPLVFHEIVVTGYASRAAETDSTPLITAAMTSARAGCLALSRDLLRTFTRNAPFDFGDWVLLPGVGVFIVQDTMAERWERRGDIWFSSRAEALQWGRRRVLVGRLTHPTIEISSLIRLDPKSAALTRTIGLEQ